MACGASEDDIQLILGTEDRVVQQFKLDFNAKLVPIFSIQLDNSIPATIAFDGNDEDILVFGLRDGNVCVVSSIGSAYHDANYGSISRHTLRNKDGKTLGTRNIGPGM